MLLTIRSGAVCFSTMPLQPSFMACTNSFLSSDAVRMMTRVRLLICCSACRAREAVQVGHAQVEQEHVGIEFVDLLQHLASVAGLAHDLEVVFQ